MLCFGRLYGILHMVKAANKLSNSQDFVVISLYLLCFSLNYINKLQHKCTDFSVQLGGLLSEPTTYIGRYWKLYLYSKS